MTFYQILGTTMVIPLAIAVLKVTFDVVMAQLSNPNTELEKVNRKMDIKESELKYNPTMSVYRREQLHSELQTLEAEKQVLEKEIELGKKLSKETNTNL